MLRYSSRIASLFAAALLIGTAPALAGPPLLCHTFDIGDARSLPWDGSNAWFQGRPDYDIRNVVADTEAILAPTTPVLVRMETLRRAALYASRDPQLAARLLDTLRARAQREAATDPLAIFDAGYLTETFRQIARLEGEREFRDSARTAGRVIGDANGYAMVTQALSRRPHDSALEFAAALIARGTGQASYQQHASRARRGAAQDALLARNIKMLS